MSDKRFIVYMDAELHKKLQYASIEMGKSMSKIAVEAIEKYLKEEGK